MWEGLSSHSFLETQALSSERPHLLLATWQIRCGRKQPMFFAAAAAPGDRSSRKSRWSLHFGEPGFWPLVGALILGSC